MAGWAEGALARRQAERKAALEAKVEDETPAPV